MLSHIDQAQMESQAAAKDDSEKSEVEKAIAGQDVEKNDTVPYTSDLPPDPDAHLSPEERAKIVRSTSPGGVDSSITNLL